MTTIMVPPPGRLAELEAIVERGLVTFVEVGRALQEIRDAKLYKATHTTFEAYCKERWNFSASRGRQLIAAAGVAGRLESVTRVTVPSERHARALAPLVDAKGPEEAARVYAKASVNGTPTVAAVEVAVAEHVIGREPVSVHEEIAGALGMPVETVVQAERDYFDPLAAMESAASAIESVNEKVPEDVAAVLDDAMERLELAAYRLRHGERARHDAAPGDVGLTSAQWAKLQPKIGALLDAMNDRHLYIGRGKKARAWRALRDAMRVLS